MFPYELKIGFYDENASVPDSKTYFDFLDKYNVRGIGSEKEGGISIVTVNSEKPLAKEALQEELGELEIISFESS